jgi:hypothetical protein
MAVLDHRVVEAPLTSIAALLRRPAYTVPAVARRGAVGVSLVAGTVTGVSMADSDAPVVSGLLLGSALAAVLTKAVHHVLNKRAPARADQARIDAAPRRGASIRA